MMVHFTVEEENLVCVYYKADRRRTMGRMTAALPDMDGDMQALARQTIRKLEAMTDADFEDVRFLGAAAPCPQVPRAARRRRGACVNGRRWGYQKSRTWSR